MTETDNTTGFASATLKSLADSPRFQPSEPAGLKPLCEGFPRHMALVDIETTGGKAIRDAITEIAVVLIDNGVVTGSWQTLLNPGVPIPPFITQLTGISSAMVKGMPRFTDIAKELLRVLENRVFVAHNARFDYGFIKQALKRESLEYTTQPLCSVKLSRALFPGFKSHSLDALIQRFHLKLPSRHRAFGDCLAIAQFFGAASKLLNVEDIQAACSDALSQAALPSHLPKSRVNKIPNSPGVYYFYDKDGELLYVGKSVSLKKRVLSHFYQDHQNPKDLEMSRLIADIRYTRTASDFSAQLLESTEIKRYSPPYNRRLKKLTKLYQFRTVPNKAGYQQVRIDPITPTSDSDMSDCGLFRSQKQAETQLRKLADSHYLCHQLLGLEPVSGRACFRAQLKRCFGPCSGQEPAHSYNDRLASALSHYRVRTWPYPGAIVIQEVPQLPAKTTQLSGDNEPCYHLINEWRYIARIRHEAELFEWGYMLANNTQNMPSNACQLNTEELTTKQIDLDKDSEQVPLFELDTYKILARFILDTSQQARCGLKIMQCRTIESPFF